MESQAESAGAPLRIGFTRGIFKNRNENDTLAAMKVWAQTIGGERGIAVDPDITIYPSLDAAISAVRAGEVDGLTMLLTEYADVPDGLLVGPFLRDVQGGVVHDEFVLLAREGGNLRAVADLAGAKLSIHDDAASGLAEVWSASRYARDGHGRMVDVVARVERVDKLSSAVLGVFFGKSDACLVSRYGFARMVELNPQVGKKLAVVAASPPVVPSIFCFRRDTDENDKAELVREIQRLHESVTGEQVLRVFKSERMLEVTAEKLAASLDLLKTWRDAARGTRDAATGVAKEGAK
jgi:phosphonate transport system substrate-binding protein